MVLVAPQANCMMAVVVRYPSPLERDSCVVLTRRGCHHLSDVLARLDDPGSNLAWLNASKMGEWTKSGGGH